MPDPAHLKVTPIERWVSAIALLVVATLGLYPPWNSAYSPEHSAQLVRAGPHALIFDPPKIGGAVAIDLSRLVVEWLAVVAIASALLVLLRMRRGDPNKSEKG